jgi:hypothetical protein
VEPLPFPGGAAAVDREAQRAWVLIDDGSVRRFGPALAWAWQQQAARLDVLVEGADAAGLVARRTVEFAHPPGVWLVSGRSLRAAVPAPEAVPNDLAQDDGDIRLYADLLQAHGADPVVEHGVLHGEVLGLEVARLIGGRLEIGVGRHDRAARAELDDQFGVGAALDQVVAAVASRRRPGAAPHPANRLARSRWLRSVVCAQPQLIGLGHLEAVAPPVPSTGVTDNSAVPAVGATSSGRAVVAVCSTGVDLDLVPTAADCRRRYAPAADLVLVMPDGDDQRVTVALASTLTRPAEIRTVPRFWESLAGSDSAQTGR